MKLIQNSLKKYNSIPIAAKATIWFMVCTMIQKCISLLTTPIFTRIMTTEQYGQFSVYNSWLQIFTILTTLRLNWAVFSKGMSKYKNDRDGYTSTMQTLTAMLTILVFLVYLIFRSYINELIELPSILIVAMFAELLVTPAIDFWTIRKRYEYVYKPVVFRTLIMALLNTAVGLVAVFIAEEKGYARILSCIAVNFAFGVVLFTYNIKKGKKWFQWEYAKFALTFNLPLLLHYLSVYILDQFDRIMIQKMVGMSAVGIYSVAYSAGMVMKIVTQSINNALVPWQYDKLEKKEFKILDDTLFIIFIGVAAVALLFSAFAPEIMMILAGEKYQGAIYVIPPVALGLFFSFVYTTFANTEFYYDQNKFTMYISMGGAALNIILNYIGITLWGYIAAAYTTLICYALFALFHYLYMNCSVKKQFHLDYVFDSKRLALLGMAVLVLGLIVISLYQLFVLRCLFILVLVILMVRNRKQIANMLAMFKK